MGRKATIIGWVMLAACVALAAGCAGSGAPTGSDPLVGEIHPTKPTPYGSTPSGPSAAPPKVSQTDPLLGNPNATALAPTGNSRPPLLINDNIATSGFNNSAFTSGYRTTAGGTTPVAVPLADAAGQPAGSYAPGTPTSEILQAQLRLRGVIWQRLQDLPDGQVRFWCIVPNRYNPDSPKIECCDARDYVSAIQAVLIKIDQK